MALHKITVKSLWNRKDVPHRDWECVSIVDLKEPIGECEMCGNTRLRYMHTMEHDDYESLDVGSICAPKMESDSTAAKSRERVLRRRASRRIGWIKRKWIAEKQWADVSGDWEDEVLHKKDAFGPYVVKTGRRMRPVVGREYVETGRSLTRVNATKTENGFTVSVMPKPAGGWAYAVHIKEFQDGNYAIASKTSNDAKLAAFDEIVRRGYHRW